MHPSPLSVVLDEWVDPAAAFVDLYADEEYAFWLDSGEHARRGTSYLGAASRQAPIVRSSVAEGTVRLLTRHPDPRESKADGSVFDFLRSPAGRLQTRRSASPVPGTAPATGSSEEAVPRRDGSLRAPGWIGWLGYEAGAEIAGIPARKAETPDAALMWADRIIAFDHVARRVTLTAERAPGAESWLASTSRRLRELRPLARLPRTEASPRATVRWRHDDAAYLRMIEECQHAIGRGDAYQLCLTNEIRVEPARDPLETYLALRALNESHRAGYLRIGEFALLSSSPEQFLTISAEGRVTTSPIKGTRARGATARADDELRAELAASEKERAENVMIVDLMRNDLSRVCEPGTVDVVDLLGVETYPRVHQLVSTVTGTLASGSTTVDAIQACFPGGSMTGAPKISAIRILHGLENGPRGVYSGCFGYIAGDGSADLAMVIRSIVTDRTGATIGTGGGITALSVPHDEVAEAKLKAAVLLEALEAETAGRSGSAGRSADL